MKELNVFDKEQIKMLYELVFRINFFTKDVVDACFNQNGKTNKDSITLQQFHILELIKNMNNDCILKEIAKKNNMSKAALSIMLSKLELMNLIEKYISNDRIDKRKINIRLTEHGQKILDEKEKAINELIKKKLENFEEEDLDYIDNIIPRLLNIVDKTKNNG